MPKLAAQDGKTLLFPPLQASPEIIRLAVMLYTRFPLSLRNVQDLFYDRGIEISHETERYWWSRFGPIFAAEIRWRRSRDVGFHMAHLHICRITNRAPWKSPIFISDLPL